MNGYRLTANEEDATQAVLGLAAGRLDENAFTAWLRGNVRREAARKGRKRSRPSERTITFLFV